MGVAVEEGRAVLRQWIESPTPLVFLYYDILCGKFHWWLHLFSPGSDRAYFASVCELVFLKCALVKADGFPYGSHPAHTKREAERSSLPLSSPYARQKTPEGGQDIRFLNWRKEKTDGERKGKRIAGIRARSIHSRSTYADLPILMRVSCIYHG